MVDDAYKYQREDGAARILQRTSELAQEHDIVIENIEWDQSEPIAERVKHALSVTANGKTVTAEFPDEWLADYPGNVGMGKADALLLQIVRQLR